MRLYAPVPEQYADFAAEVARDSACFQDWAIRILADPPVQEWIERLPPVKQQPHLVFAAARWHGVPAPGPYHRLREALLDDDGTIVATIMARATQTNEVGRLATLAPVFARIAHRYGGPLALIEAGPSAGLCLFPDRYTYRYLPRDEESAVVAGSGPQGYTWTPGRSGPELVCRVRRRFEVWGGFEVAWRGGVDLRPLDVSDDDAMDWLQMLIWPEQEDRRRRLRAAIEIAREQPPELITGDLLTDLEPLVAHASSRGRPVVFHSAVAGYLKQQDRDRLVALMTALVDAGRCHWVSNEDKKTFPQITERGRIPPERHPTFVLGLDGTPLAWTHGHGRSMTWFGDEAGW